MLAAQVVLLSVRNRALAAELAAAAPRPASENAPERARLEVGDELRPFHLRAADGTIRAVEFEEWATLLLVFADQCSACPLAFPEWERLVEPFQRASVPVLGLWMDPPDGVPGHESAGRPFPVYTLTDAREVPLAELATVPFTALLDQDGRVLWRHYGPLSEELREELLAFAAP